MGKYLLKRILHGVVSIIIVVAIVMVLIYSMLDRELVFVADNTYTRQVSNAKTAYMYTKWEEYGYLDYVTYSEWLNGLAREGEIDEATRAEAVAFGRKPENDTPVAKEYVEKFTEYYESQGYTITRLNAKMNGRKLVSGGAQLLFAAKDLPLTTRLWSYFTGLGTSTTSTRRKRWRGSGA